MFPVDSDLLNPRPSLPWSPYTCSRPCPPRSWNARSVPYWSLAQISRGPFGSERTRILRSCNPEERTAGTCDRGKRASLCHAGRAGVSGSTTTTNASSSALRNQSVCWRWWARPGRSSSTATIGPRWCSATQSHIKTYPDYVGPKCKT